MLLHVSSIECIFRSYTNIKTYHNHIKTNKYFEGLKIYKYAKGGLLLRNSFYLI